MLVRELMSGAGCTVRSTDSVMDCARVMRDRKIGFVVVLDDDDRVVGAVTDRDLAVRLVAADLPVTSRVSVIMSSDHLLSVRPGSDARALQELMSSRRQFRAAVVDELERLVGIVSWIDLVAAELGAPRGPAAPISRAPIYTH